MNTEEYRNKIYNNLIQHVGLYEKDDWNDFFQNHCNEMLSFMEEQNKKADIFENSNNKGQHQHFWEVLVGNTLLEKGYKPQRDKRDGAPDYFFEQDGVKFHVEAKAPTEGTVEELKPKQITMLNAETINDKNSFQSGIIDGNNCILRFTSILDAAIKQINTKFYRLGRVIKNDKIIIAINGSNVVKNTEIHMNNFNAGCLSYGFNIFCALYGLDGNEFYLPDENVYVLNEAYVKKNGISVPNRFFCSGNDTPIDGVIYSNVDIKNYFSYDHQFLFFPNPNKEDISNYFPFCKIIKPPIRYIKQK